MKTRRSGFTLMEIMVVIIVIAVLASVAGPMIGSITDQGRASATKSKISSLKSAILAYKSDIGRIPFIGLPANIGDGGCYNKASNVYLGTNEAANVLVNEDVGCADMNITNYKRKWKGPYMDAAPEDFMMDSWGTKIVYVGYEKNIYLWSAGADMAFSPLTDVLCATTVEADAIDDIIQSIARVRKDLNTDTAYDPNP